MCKKNISIIGATGNLGIPVVFNLNKLGYNIKVISRNPEKASSLFKHLDSVEIVEADLRSIISLKKALKGTSYLYLNLSTNTIDMNTPFLPEREGVSNILKSIDKNSIKQIISISGLGALDNFSDKNKFEFVPNIIRKQGHKLIKNSGIPYTILHCSWFADSFMFYQRKGVYSVIGNNRSPVYFTNSYDYSKHLANAIGNEKAYYKEFPVQGTKGIIHSKAAEEFYSIYDNKVKVKVMPLNLVKILSVFIRQMKFIKHMAEYFNSFDEEFISKDYETYKILGNPENSISDFADKLKLDNYYSYLKSEK